MKKIILAIVVLCLTFTVFAQDTTIHWMSFEQVSKAFVKKQKPIIIWIYDQDCDSCSLMEEKTFKNSEVVKYINVLFYPIKLDARTKDTITFFNGKKFVHVPGKTYHQLVYLFLKDSLKFPAMVVFDKHAQGRVFYGYRDRDHIFPILIYSAEEIYKSTPYEQWVPLYFKTYPPGVPQVISRLFVHWTDINKIDDLEKKQPRKVIVDVYNRYNVAATVMRLQAYNNPIIASYLNSHFYVTTVEARAKDTIVFNSHKFPPSDKYPYHTLAIDLLAGKMEFPAFVVLDTNYQLLDREQVFLTPADFYKIITYFGGNYYKKMSFEQYLKEHKDELDKKIKQIEKYYKRK